jgi:uncharacterized protein (DUF608 family)
MKTPMQKLIDQAIQRSRELSEEGRLLESLAVDYIIDLAKAQSMLEKEKEVMCQFQSDGQRTDFWVKYEDNEDCFDETFKTKER